MAERCIRCNVSNDEVRLFDAVYEGRMCSFCERCSIIENVPIIKKPDASQLRESEKGLGVYERMKRMSGIKDVEEEKTFFKEDRLKELDKNPILELPPEDQLKLIDHFHWEIMRHRRRRGLSQEKLAEAISESVSAIEMIEKGKLPEDAKVLIKKLEQLFQVKLRRIIEMDELMKVERKEEIPVLLDERGNQLEQIPEEEIKQPEVEIEEVEVIPESVGISPEIEYKLVGAEAIENGTEIEEFGKEEIEGLRAEPEPLQELEQPKEPELTKEGELDVKATDIREVTIGNLKEIHKKKIEVTRQEQIEEQKEIEKRQRLIEARKEELRLMKEKESQELDEILGGIELIGVDEEPEESEEIKGSEMVEEFDEELI